MRLQRRNICQNLVLVASFVFITGCDVYSDNSVFNTFTSVCTGAECIQENEQFLELKINSEGDIPVSASTARFDVGGECNEGGFESNIIVWSLYYNDTFIQNSTAVGQDAECKLGRFQAKVLLNLPNETSRTGLAIPGGGGARAPHILEVEIRGIDKAGKDKTNTLAKRRIFLQPI